MVSKPRCSKQPKRDSYRAGVVWIEPADGWQTAEIGLLMRCNRPFVRGTTSLGLVCFKDE